ncbi:hypothetical protein HN843_07795, partial [bacterium]|nr:hypothetical protein [bacterium]
MFLYAMAGVVFHLGVKSSVPVAVKLTIDIVLLILLFKLLHYFLIQPLSSIRSLKKFCAELEKHGAYSNHLNATEELFRQPERWFGEQFDRGLTDRLLEVAQNDIEKIVVARILPFRAGVKILVTSVIGLLFAGFLFFTVGQSLQDGLLRVVDPFDNENLPPEVSLYLEQESMSVSAGQSVEVSVLDAGVSKGKVECKYRYGGGVWKSVVAIEEYYEGIFTKYKSELPELNEPVEYY